ncbi:MAG: hypothetical protein P4M11_03785 [Candidatus Pacebacteria bacterium]|nr:hypothetical protein [Candidatus Paceibacterota bacterium]
MDEAEEEGRLGLGQVGHEGKEGWLVETGNRGLRDYEERQKKREVPESHHIVPADYNNTESRSANSV